MSSKKERLDILLVEKGICNSRERAKTNIMAGLVFVDGHRVDKAGEKVNRDAEIIFKGEELNNEIISYFIICSSCSDSCCLW